MTNSRWDKHIKKRKIYRVVYRLKDENGTPLIGEKVINFKTKIFTKQQLGLGVKILVQNYWDKQEKKLKVDEIISLDLIGEE